MTAKEALWVFEKRRRCAESENCGYRHTKCDYWVDADELKEAEQKAVEALEKQIPKEPMKEEHSEEAFEYRLYCPSCGSCIGYRGRMTGQIAQKYRNEYFCGKCGQAIDWGEGEG